MENTQYEAQYETVKEMVRNIVKVAIAEHKSFGLTASDVSKDMALVVAQAIREVTKEDNNG